LLLNLMSIVNLNKGIYMLINKWYIKKPNGNFVIISRPIKETLLLEFLKELSLLLYLASSKKIPLRFNLLICCRCPIDIGLIKG
jgi:hypothetical protein